MQLACSGQAGPSKHSEKNSGRSLCRVDSSSLPVRRSTTLTTKFSAVPRNATWVDLAIWVVAWTLLGIAVFYSLGPVPPGVRSFEYADKVFHAAIYAANVFAYFLAAVWRPGRGEGRFPWAAPWILVGALAAGIGMELLQGAFFGRDAEVGDAVADAVGELAGFMSWMLLRIALPVDCR
jgi:VanZ family protein